MLTFKKCLKKETNKNEKLIKATKMKNFSRKIPCIFGFGIIGQTPTLALF